MANAPAANRSTHPHRILVVDDEKGIRELLAAVLSASKHDVATAENATEARASLQDGTFDLVVTDLKLPDGDGIEILARAKELDLNTEGIVITGYASVDTATAAINLGVSSYLTKPISLKTFSAQVDRALANRDFRLRSQELIAGTGQMDNRAAKQHLWSITTFYDLSRRLMMSIDIAEIMRTALTELNEKLNASFSAVGVSLFGESEVFAMPREGTWSPETINNVLHAHWDSVFGMLDPKEFSREHLSLMPLEGKAGDSAVPPSLTPLVTPMIVMGKTIGSIGAFKPPDESEPVETHQFLHVFSSLVSPLVENGYVHKKTKALAGTDPLTGIANHRSFHEMLSREIARADRENGEFCLLMLDIDDFKQVNDTYGHLIGDAVLRDLTSKINGAIREGDMLARYGGEEFTILLPNTTAEGSVTLAERIRKAVFAHPYSFYEKDILYTVSVGQSLYSGRSPRNKESLIQDADEALYESKRAGKNRVTAH